MYILSATYSASLARESPVGAFFVRLAFWVAWATLHATSATGVGCGPGCARPPRSKHLFYGDNEYGASGIDWNLRY
jgi:hypothetical protein